MNLSLQSNIFGLGITEEAIGNFTAEAAPPTTNAPVSVTGKHKPDDAVEFDINRPGGANGVNQDAGVNTGLGDRGATANHDISQSSSDKKDKDSKDPKIDLSGGNGNSRRCPTKWSKFSCLVFYFRLHFLC